LLRTALLLFLAGAATCLPLRSHASVPCRSKQPTTVDAVGLRVAVRKVAGARTSRLVIRDYCDYVSDALVDLQSPVAHRREGVREWATVHCRREDGDADNWQCEPLEIHRGTKLLAMFDGNSRPVDIEFPPAMPVATARDLVLRAVAVQQASDAPTRCGKSATRPEVYAVRPWKVLRDYLVDAANRPPYGVSALVQEDPAAGTTEVSLDGTLAIESPTGCWIEIEWIVVT